MQPTCAHSEISQIHLVRYIFFMQVSWHQQAQHQVLQPHTFSQLGARGGLGLVGREYGGGSMRLIRKDPDSAAF